MHDTYDYGFHSCLNNWKQSAKSGKIVSFPQKYKVIASLKLTRYLKASVHMLFKFGHQGTRQGGVI